jgi:hydroxyethylthiazole kinase-like uncharacterized protein yjeF
MARRFTREAARAVDREAIDDWGLPGAALMENAAAAVEAAVLEELAALVAAGVAGVAGDAIAAGDAAIGPVVVACGTGNNGGDGWAVARRLRNRRDDGEPVPEVRVLAWADPRPGSDAATQAAVTRRMGVAVLAPGAASAGPRPSLVVDAVLGTGLDRAAAGEAAAVIALIERWRGAGSRVVAVDVPSGLDADTGRPAGGGDGPAVRADLTVSLMGPKAGFADPASRRWTGRVLVGDIGVPRAILDRHASA